MTAGRRNLLLRLSVFGGFHLLVFLGLVFLSGGIPKWLGGSALYGYLKAVVSTEMGSFVVGIVLPCALLLYLAVKVPPLGWSVTAGTSPEGLYLGHGRWWMFKGDVYHSENLKTKEVKLVVGDDVLCRHMHVLGGSGSGKTVSVLQNLALQHIERGGGMIVLDAKTDYDTIRLLYLAAVKAGRQHEFHLFDLADPLISESYNPLMHGEPHEIAEKVLSTFDFSDVFYEQRQRMTMHSTIKAIVEVQKLLGKPFNFRDLLWVLYFIPHSLDFLFELLKDVPGREAADTREQLEMLKKEPVKNLVEHIAGVKSQLHRYSYGLPDPFKINSYKPQIDLKRIIERGEIAYFSLNSMTYQQIAYCTARLVLQDVQSIAGRLQYGERRSKLPFIIFMDEAGEYLYEEFETFLKQSRSAGFACIIMHQAAGDLRKRVDFRSQVESNTEMKVILRVNDPETRESFSRTLGTMIAKRKIVGRSYGHFLEGVEAVLPRSQEREIEEEIPLLRPESLAALQTGAGYVVWGMNIFRVKFPYHRKLLAQAKKVKLPYVGPSSSVEAHGGMRIDLQLKAYLRRKGIKEEKPFPDELPVEIPRQQLDSHRHVQQPAGSRGFLDTATVDEAQA